MAFEFTLIGVAILVLGGLGHLAAGISKVDLGNGVKFTYRPGSAAAPSSLP